MRSRALDSPTAFGLPLIWGQTFVCGFWGFVVCVHTDFRTRPGGGGGGLHSSWSGYDARHMLPDRSEIDPVLVSGPAITRKNTSIARQSQSPSPSSKGSPDTLLSPVLIELRSLLGYYFGSFSERVQTVSMDFSLEHAYRVSTRLCPDAALSYGLSQHCRYIRFAQKSFCACRNREFIARLG